MDGDGILFCFEPKRDTNESGAKLGLEGVRSFDIVGVGGNLGRDDCGDIRSDCGAFGIGGSLFGASGSVDGLLIKRPSAGGGGLCGDIRGDCGDMRGDCGALGIGGSLLWDCNGIAGIVDGAVGGLGELLGIDGIDCLGGGVKIGPLGLD